MYVYKLLDGGMYADFQRYEAARISIPFFSIVSIFEGYRDPLFYFSIDLFILLGCVHAFPHTAPRDGNASHQAWFQFPVTAEPFQQPLGVSGWP